MCCRCDRGVQGGGGNRILDSEKMPEEWRRSVLAPIFKNKGDVQSCSNYRGIKLMSHTMKLWERVVEARLRVEVSICRQQYGFMPKKEYYRCSVCSEDVDTEVERRSEGAALCLCVSGESRRHRLPQRGTVLMFEQAWQCRQRSMLERCRPCMRAVRRW